MQDLNMKLKSDQGIRLNGNQIDAVVLDGEILLQEKPRFQRN